MTEENQEKTERFIVIPGEVIAQGDDYLPGEETERIGEKIIARKFGLAEISKGLVRIIPLSGVYYPRKGNLVVGRVENVTFNGWLIDIGAAENGFLSLTEVPKYVNKYGLEEVMDIGDTVVAKITSVNKRSIDLTVKGRNLGKMDEGLIVKINSHKVPKVIGKEGVRVNMIKNETGCNITIGQNGIIIVRGDSIEKELIAKEAILFLAKKSLVNDVTEELEKFLKEKVQDIEGGNE